MPADTPRGRPAEFRAQEIKNTDMLQRILNHRATNQSKQVLLKRLAEFNQSLVSLDPLPLDLTESL